MIPLARIIDYFKEQAGLLVSKGSISNFKKVAVKKLEEIGFKAWPVTNFVGMNFWARGNDFPR